MVSESEQTYHFYLEHQPKCISFHLPKMATFNTVGVLMLVALATANINITSPPITNWGVWGRFQRCPFGRAAQGFQLKTEPNQYLGDDTALNAIRLFCGDPFRPDTAIITSTVGDFGDWGNVYTCYPGVLTGFQLRVESNRNSGDDTATNNARFWCSSLPNPNDYIQGDGMSWGDWSEPRHCYAGQAITGIQTQVEPYQEDGDDTMLNNVMMECSQYSMSQLEADYLRVKQMGVYPPAAVSPKFAALLKDSNAHPEKSSNFSSLYKNVLQALHKGEVKSAEKAESSKDFAVTVKALAQALNKAQKTDSTSGKETPTDFAVLAKAFSEALNKAKSNSVKTAKTSKDFSATMKTFSEAFHKAQENVAKNDKTNGKAAPNPDFAVYVKAFSEAFKKAQENSSKKAKNQGQESAALMKTFSQALKKVQENSSKTAKSQGQDSAAFVKSFSQALHKAQENASKTGSTKSEDNKNE